MKTFGIIWLFITCVIGTAQLPAIPQQPKPKYNQLPPTWAESLKQIELI